jgi:hypothetical protein
MLINLAISLRGLGDDAQANRVSRRALELPADYTTPYHRTWLAFDDALAGATAAAAEGLGGLDVSPFDATHKYVHRMVEALLAVQQAAPPERGAACARARRQLDEAEKAFAPLTDDRPALLQAYRRCVRRLAKDGGGLSARVWSAWRSRRPRLPAATVDGKKGVG